MKLSPPEVGMDLTQPIRIMDGSPDLAHPQSSTLIWSVGTVWVVLLILVAWIAVLRHRNRFGAAARLCPILSAVRGLTRQEMQTLRDISLYESKDQAGLEGAHRVLAAMLLIPDRAAAGLDRAWDRTQGTRRAELISLRTKLGVLGGSDEEADVPPKAVETV